MLLLLLHRLRHRVRSDAGRLRRRIGQLLARIRAHLVLRVVHHGRAGVADGLCGRHHGHTVHEHGAAAGHRLLGVLGGGDDNGCCVDVETASIVSISCVGVQSESNSKSTARERASHSYHMCGALIEGTSSICDWLTQ